MSNDVQEFSTQQSAVALLRHGLTPDDYTATLDDSVRHCRGLCCGRCCGAGIARQPLSGCCCCSWVEDRADQTTCIDAGQGARWRCISVDVCIQVHIVVAVVRISVHVGGACWRGIGSAWECMSVHAIEGQAGPAAHARQLLQGWRRHSALPLTVQAPQKATSMIMVKGSARTSIQLKSKQRPKRKQLLSRSRNKFDTGRVQLTTFRVPATKPILLVKFSQASSAIAAECQVLHTIAILTRSLPDNLLATRRPSTLLGREGIEAAETLNFLTDCCSELCASLLHAEASAGADKSWKLLGASSAPERPTGTYNERGENRF